MNTADKKAALAGLLTATIKQDYDSEKRVLKNLDEMIAHAESDQLRHHFEHHKEETQHQIERLDKVSKILEQDLERYKTNEDKSLVDKTIELLKNVIHYAPEAKCHGMQGILEDGHMMLKMFAKTPISDDVIIAAALKVEHFEIAAYEMICNAADQLGQHQVSAILKESLQEEKSMADKLMRLAEERKFLSSRLAKL